MTYFRLRIWAPVISCTRTSPRWFNPCAFVWYRITRTLRRSRWARYSWYGCGLAWSILIIYYTLICYNDKQRLAYVVPETCVDESCQLSKPLPQSQLPPNLLLILIHASVRGINRRTAIRKTWAKDITNKDTSPIQYRFVLGGSGVSPDKLHQLEAESSKHQDMIILPTITDSLYTLTQRTLYGFKYTYKRFKFDYILKCDDDDFVDVLRLATELHKRPSKDRINWGAFRGHARVLSWGTYREIHWSICSTYLPYAYGGGYILSRDLIQLLVESEPYLKQYKSEDVAVAAWLAPYNVERKHDSRFNTRAYTKGCKWPYLVSHKVPPSTMYSLQSSLEDEGIFCSLRRTYYHRYHGYLYNWTSPVYQCCNSNDDVP